ncbi:alpha/beta hydrolase fold domain-containing protein [Halomonas sp. HNIBRBA4712]|uniref:alpha/beta hydrolase fold domain-containing protein n=1 Tax=Halomonas sp. HNIBRBA4712 TaxID=3373087 RepID=UPI003747197F
MKIETFIRRFEAGLEPLATLPIALARKRYDALCQSFAPPDPAGMRIDDAAVDGLPLRRFVPAGAARAPVVFLHGGGFTLGSSASHHGIAASLAQALGREVISLDYPRAPEASYAATTRRCIDVIEALCPAALVGDSAGARLAMDCSHAAGLEVPLGLVYPPVNDLRAQTLGPDAPLLSRQDVLFLSPLCPPLGDASPTPLPNSVVEVLAVEHDPLTAPLERVVAAWRREGASVGYRCAPHMVHAALHAHAHLPEMQSAWQTFCQALKDHLGAAYS